MAEGKILQTALSKNVAAKNNLAYYSTNFDIRIDTIQFAQKPVLKGNIYGNSGVRHEGC